MPCKAPDFAACWPRLILDRPQRPTSGFTFTIRTFCISSLNPTHQWHSSKLFMIYDPKTGPQLKSWLVKNLEPMYVHPLLPLFQSLVCGV